MHPVTQSKVNDIDFLINESKHRILTLYETNWLKNNLSMLISICEYDFKTSVEKKIYQNLVELHDKIKNGEIKL